MKRVSWIIVLLLMMGLVLAACGGAEPEVAVEEPVTQEQPTEQEEDPDPPAVEEPVAEEPEEEAPVAEEPEAEEQQTAEEPEEEMSAETEVSVADIQFTSLDELTSYRYVMEMEITATDSTGEETTQSVQMELAVSSDPPATSMIMTAEGTEEIEDMGEMQFVQIEDTSYINMAGMGCVALPADDNAAMSTDELTDGFSPEAITEDLENVSFEGEETINGIDVLHYSYDESALTAEEAIGITSMTGDIYVAKEGGYMVRSVMEAIGDSKFMVGFAEGDVQVETAVTKVEMNLIDVNEAVEILPPEACEGQEAGGSDWPMMDDASEVASFGGIVSYTTEATAEDTIEFYNGAMDELGFALDENGSFTAPGSGLLTYVNIDDESVTVTIAQDADSGLTTVTILTDAEE